MFGLKVDLEKRHPGLDLARAVAISLVVFAHTLWIGDNYPASIRWLMQFSGTIGVEIFFVISGFLIGRIILNLISQPHFSLSTIGEFLKRRWFRTLPNYYLVLMLNILLWYILYHQIPDKLYLYLVYLQNFSTTSPAFYRISWSLAVEQFSYIMAPLFLFLAIKIFPNIKREKLFLGMVLTIILLGILSRIYFNQNNTLNSLLDWNEKLRKVTFFRLDAIYYGFLGYYFYQKNSFKNFKNILFLIGILFLLFLQIGIFILGFTIQNNSFFFNVMYLPLNSISIFLLIPFLLEIKFKNLFFVKSFTLLSLLSYSIYLLHYTIILHAMKNIFPSEQLTGFSLWMYTFLYWSIVIVSSYVLYRFYEKPCTNMREIKKT